MTKDNIPDTPNPLDDILRSCIESLRQEDVCNALYLQIFRDCLTLIRRLNSDTRSYDNCLQDPDGASFTFLTSDRRLEQFLYAHDVRFAEQRRINGKTHWAYPWSPQVARLLEEYSRLPSFKGGVLIHENAH